MNTHEAMQALLDGKKIRPSHGVSKKDFIWLSAGTLVWSCGQTAHLNGDYTYEIYEEPNPHAKGTFAWAREESKRGRKVLANVDEHEAYSPGELHEPNALVYIEELESTNWQVVE